MPYLKRLSDIEAFDDCPPWEFSALEKVPKECFSDKKARDAWANDPSTDFHFYSLATGVISNLRIRAGSPAESNPPFSLAGLAVDYDCPTDLTSVESAMKIMDGPRPNYFEQTLSGNGRLVWRFAEPIRCPSRKFAVAILKGIDKILPVDRLPGLDRGALLEPGRYYANGCRWTPLSKVLVPAAALRGFVMRVAERFDWADKELGPVAVSFEAIAEECRKRYPRFSEWEAPFEPGSQGPSFWLDSSRSQKSAILKPTGIFTFSGSASKSFYSWSELVGAELVARTEDELMGRATENVFFDGRNYFMPAPDGTIRCYETQTLRRQLTVHKGVSDRKNKDGSPSAVDKALAYLELHNFIDGAASAAFYPHGIFVHNGKRILNLHRREALKPSPKKTEWGASGGFPFLSEFFDGFFAPKFPQSEHFLSWLQYFYRSCLDRSPRSGHGVILAGGVNTGKTFTSRGIVGGLVGGCAEANAYLVQGDNFNSELFDYSLWVCDDGSMTTTNSMHRLFSESVKRAIANREHRVNEKFRRAVSVPWQGRFFLTVNDDPVSIAGIPALDGSILEKLMLLKAGERTIAFRSQPEMERILKTELPWFARWLLDWTPPAHCFEGADPRFGVTTYCHPVLQRTSNLSSAVSSFAEILTRWLTEYFNEAGKGQTFWTGSAIDLRLSMSASPAFAETLRGYKPDAIPRMLLQLNDKRMFKMSVSETDNERHFTIQCEDRFRKSPKAQASVPQAVGSNFEKK